MPLSRTGLFTYLFIYLMIVKNSERTPSNDAVIINWKESGSKVLSINFKSFFRRFPGASEENNGSP
jgi:hypothetical protein